MNAQIRIQNQKLIESLEKDGGLIATQRIVDGEISEGGLCETLRIHFKEVSEGRMVVECEYDPALHSNPFGIANGGWHGAMIDNAGGYAALSTVQPGYGAFTKTMGEIKYYKPVISGVFQAIGTVERTEGNKVYAYAKIVDQDGECYAEAPLVVSVQPIEKIREQFEMLGFI